MKAGKYKRIHQLMSFAESNNKSENPGFCSHMVAKELYGEVTQKTVDCVYPLLLKTEKSGGIGVCSFPGKCPNTTRLHKFYHYNKNPEKTLEPVEYSYITERKNVPLPEDLCKKIVGKDMPLFSDFLSTTKEIIIRITKEGIVIEMKK